MRDTPGVTDTLCPCGAPTRDDAAICDACTRLLRRLLGEVPAVVRELMLQVTRQSQSGPRVGARSSEKPLPFNDHAAKMRDELHRVLAGASFEVATSLDTDPPIGAAQWHAAWLVGHMDALRVHKGAAGILEAVKGAHRDATRAFDRTPDRVFAGPCLADIPISVDLGPGEQVTFTTGDVQCPAELYAKAGARSVKCKNCGAEFDVAERRAWLLQEVEDILWPAKDIAGALPWFMDELITADTVKGMARHGLISQRGTLPSTYGEDTVLYKVGDVISVLRSRAERRGNPRRKSA